MNVYKAILLRPPYIACCLSVWSTKVFPKKFESNQVNFYAFFQSTFYYTFPRIYILCSYCIYNTSIDVQAIKHSFFYTNYQTKYLYFLEYNFSDELHLFPRPHCAKVQKYEEGKIGLQFFKYVIVLNNIVIHRTLWKKNLNPARVSFWGLTNSTNQSISAQKGGMALPC